MATREVLFVVFPGVQAIDLAGPFQAFATADEEAGGGRYRLRVATAPRAGSIALHGGLPVRAEAIPSTAVDTLVVPGGPGVHEARVNGALTAGLRTAAGRARRVCSICSGAFLLAELGLLHGRRAATHWQATERLASEFPDVRVEPDPIWIREDHIWTSAGVTAGIDLTLALIEDDLGPAVAARTARRLLVHARRSGGQAQYSRHLALQVGTSFVPLLDWITENLHRPLTVDTLAERVGLSPRTFHRRFMTATGETPARAVERLRLETARRLIETTPLALGLIARETGFGDSERLRRAFVRHHGTCPRHLRPRPGYGKGFS